MSNRPSMLVGTPLLQVFGRLGCGGLILSTEGHVLAANAEAHRILHDVIGLTQDELTLIDGGGRDAVKRLLARSKTRVQLDGENWILTMREGKRPLIMSAILVPVIGEEMPHTVLLLIDLEQTPSPHTAAIEKVFGLTAAEARLAALLAGGATVSEAATAHSVSVATIRTQLASIFAKTRTNRQAELVMLISRLSALV